MNGAIPDRETTPHPNPSPLAGEGTGGGLSSDQPQRTDLRPMEVALSLRELGKPYSPPGSLLCSYPI
jgi:hypothetical protein